MAVRMLDATLRDGSYCVNFQFTAADTAVLVGMLDEAGVGFIEVGHGSGTFNHKAPANFRSSVRQAIPDEEYLAVARRCATRAKLGVITGPFGIDDLHVLAQHRVDFVRLAAMADRALEPSTIKWIERAKSLGLTASINLMQTTAITPARLAEVAVELARAGADWLYIVDSSGGLLPGAVTEYVTRVRESGMTIGFHAHHNSGLAIANCLAAIEAGATLVDGTLQGLGRDVGNAPTEQLLFLLQRIGHERAIDVEGVSHAGDLVRRLLLERGNDPTYFAAGASEIHSSNVQALVDLAESKGLGARSLLAAIGHGTTKLIGAGMKTFPEEVLGPAISRARSTADIAPRADIVDVIATDITRSSSSTLSVLADVLYARASKMHRQSVLHLVPASQFAFDGPLPWQLDRWCGITLGVEPNATLEFGDRVPDVVIADPSLGMQATLTDPFGPLLVDAVFAVIALVPHAHVLCSDPALAAMLAARGARLGSQGDTVIVVDRDVPVLGPARVLRPALASVIAARIATLLDLHARLSAGNAGELVDPIFAPTDRQIVVDDPACPSTVVGGATRERAVVAATARAKSFTRGRGQL